MSTIGRIADAVRQLAYGQMSNAELFTRFLRLRDDRAVTELIERCRFRLESVCRSYLSDKDEIDDVIQDVYRVMIERADTVREPAAIESWLEQTAINIVRNRFRRRDAQSTSCLPPAELEGIVVDPSPTPPVIAELREKHAHVLAEIEHLSEDWRKAFKLRLLDDLPYAEVARILDSSLAKVKQDVCRARKQLRSQLLRKGIVLPASLAAVLVGNSAIASARNRVSSLILGLLITAALGVVSVVYWRIGGETDKFDVAELTNTPQAPGQTPTEPAESAQVLPQVLTLLDRLAGAQARRTEAEYTGLHSLRWRFAWTPHPGNESGNFRYHPWITRESWIDLLFDRWNGALTINLASDGKTPRMIQPLRPFVFELFGREWTMPIPELEEVWLAFEPLLLPAKATSAAPAAPNEPQEIRFVRLARNEIAFRPPPEFGVTFRVEPGAGLRFICRAGTTSKSAHMFIWQPGTADAVQGLSPGNDKWDYVNQTLEPVEVFVAACREKSGRWRTCQFTRTRLEEQHAWDVRFDADYASRFTDLYLDVIELAKNR